MAEILSTKEPEGYFKFFKKFFIKITIKIKLFNIYLIKFFFIKLINLF